jgi:hypothetical protein
MNTLRTFKVLTVDAWSKAWTVFARPNTGIVGWNPTRDMDVCVRSFCVDRGLATGWSPVQRVLPSMYKIKKLKKEAKVHKGCRAIGR